LSKKFFHNKALPAAPFSSVAANAGWPTEDRHAFLDLFDVLPFSGSLCVFDKESNILILHK
jgi:hypothetical protein